MIRRILAGFLVAMVVLAVWRGAHGDVNVVVANVSGFLSAGADVVTHVWNAAFGLVAGA